MRSFIVMGMFIASLSSAAWQEHVEARDLLLPAEGIAAFDLDTGSGFLIIKGVPDADDIRVKAIIRLQDEGTERAQELITSDMKLTLVKSRDRAKLKAAFDSKFWGRESDGSIDLEIEVPVGLPLVINDASDFIDISDVEADVVIDDGSGAISVRNVGNIRINDGSGSIDVTAAAGDVSIDDGSGGVKVGKVGGSATINDGSGEIIVSEVEHNLIIVEDGSGGLSVSDARGSVKRNRS